MTRLHAATRGDQGTTLVELLVVTVLLGLIGVMVLGTLVQGLQVTRRADARTTNAQAARVALESMTRSLRTATDPAEPSTDPDPKNDSTEAFVTARPGEVVFYAALGNRTGNAAAGDAPPSRVRYWVDSTPGRARELREQVVPPVVDPVTRDASWPGAGTTRTLARGVVEPTPACPLFVFQARADAPTSPCDPAAAGPVPALNGLARGADGSVSGVALSTIGAVEVWLRLETGTDRPVRTTAVDRVTLLNVDQ